MNNKFDFSSKFRMANIFSLFIFISSIAFILFKGLNYGIDFKGGTLIELRANNTDAASIRSTLNSMNLGDVNVKKFGKEGDYLIKVEQKENNDNKIIPLIKKKLSENLNTETNFRRVENVGPKVSSELLQSGIIAISLSLAAMLFYIWIRFEWQFSIGSIIALFHDVVITMGIFSILSLEINLSIIAAVLTIVGYSMNDTVVIYDRIRENLNKYTRLNISEIANLSINDTLARTIITSATTLLALLSIFILGGEILRGFSFAMILGVIIGTYSSIFVASPMLKFFKVTYKTLEKEEEKIVP
ncbi:protein translocase subunit SecF [Pelagibacteraceae bacterium]|jgi:preprotein translocase subunit SecF|nr:protein translocase subunit SecF [Pelagibacteraceae bacterium]|tara:strand:- start:538 stop:1440 length:903 start_codon:yes stop_codon:yes gene_type:complete